MASHGYEEELLHHWFLPQDQETEPRAFVEKDIREISAILERAGKPSWSRVPRLYIVLRLIHKLDVIDNFIQHGMSDTWFPFDQRSLPERLPGHSDRVKFLETQKIVCNTKALNLERSHAGHGHFPFNALIIASMSKCTAVYSYPTSHLFMTIRKDFADWTCQLARDPNDIPLRKVGELGKGGSGFVERVVSTVTHREYALKRIKRGTTFRKDKQVLRDFENELSNLKTLSRGHIHIIEVMGSFTEPKYVGILFPVADCNLGNILERPDIQNQRWSLRSYFGCLASALGFLHNNNIRHKDIKPQNILIKDDTPYFTDFGVSIDWTEYGQSTTIGPTAMTPRYSAPEVAACEPRNTTSDIWSLGCVFLEMYAALKGATSKDVAEHFTRNGQLQPYYSSNPPISTWINQLRGLATTQSDNLPIRWIKHMVAPKREDRWSAHLVVEQIRDCSTDPAARFLYIGKCCLDNDDTAESVTSYTESNVEDPQQNISNEPARDSSRRDAASAASRKRDVNQAAMKAADASEQHPTDIGRSPAANLDDHFQDLHIFRAASDGSHEQSADSNDPSRDADERLASENGGGKSEGTLDVIAEYFIEGGGQTDIPKALVSQDLLESVLTVPFVLHGTVYRIARPMTEQSVGRLIRVCRASLKFQVGDGDSSRQPTSPGPAPYVYRVRKRFLSEDEASSRDKSEAPTRSDQHNSHHGEAIDSLEPSDHDDTDESTVQMMLANSNVTYDHQVGCTIFMKHFVLASAIRDLGYEVSENKHFFCITGHLDRNQQCEIIRMSRDRIRQLGQAVRSKSHGPKLDDSRGTTTSEQYAHHSASLERNGSTPSVGDKHVVADTPNTSYSSAYREPPNTHFQGNRYGSPNSWYSHEQQPLESSVAQQRPRVAPLQHHSHGSSTFFDATRHASPDYAPVYEEPRTMSTPPRRPTYVAMHDGRGPGGSYAAYANHGFGSPGPVSEQDGHNMPYSPFANNGYTESSSPYSEWDNCAAHTPEYIPMYDDMNDHLQSQGQPRVPPSASAQWAAPPPPRPGYVPIYLLQDGRPTFSGWRKIHPNTDPYSGHH